MSSVDAVRLALQERDIAIKDAKKRIAETNMRADSTKKQAEKNIKNLKKKYEFSLKQMKAKMQFCMVIVGISIAVNMILCWLNCIQ